MFATRSSTVAASQILPAVDCRYSSCETKRGKWILLPTAARRRLSPIVVCCLRCVQIVLGSCPLVDPPPREIRHIGRYKGEDNVITLKVVRIPPRVWRLRSSYPRLPPRDPPPLFVSQESDDAHRRFFFSLQTPKGASELENALKNLHKWGTYASHTHFPLFLDVFLGNVQHKR